MTEIPIYSVLCSITDCLIMCVLHLRLYTEDPLTIELCSKKMTVFTVNHLEISSCGKQAYDHHTHTLHKELCANQEFVCPSVCFDHHHHHVCIRLASLLIGGFKICTGTALTLWDFKQMDRYVYKSALCQDGRYSWISWINLQRHINWIGFLEFFLKESIQYRNINQILSFKGFVLPLFGLS